jgi:signal transduction histidine kinase
MKLAWRMTFAFSAAATLLFGLDGLFLLRNEEQELRTVAEDEARLLARSLQLAFEHTLRDRPIREVSETLQALGTAEPSVAIFVYDELGKLVEASERVRATPDVSELEARARKQDHWIIEYAQRRGKPVLRLGLRLRPEVAAGFSTLILEKPLDELRRDLAATRNNIAASVIGFVFAVAFLSLILTRVHVVRPLASMVENMRRVREGDLSVLPAKSRDDEVGATQEEFQALVTELDAARARARDELEARRRIERALQSADKLITLGQLSAVLAHEIGSPLQVLEGRARALQRHAEEPAVVRKTADILVEHSERITRIVSQLLSITRRPSAVKRRLHVEPLVRSVVDLLELEARRRNVRLDLQVVGKTIATADADKLQQVALNLVRNALEAAREGGSVSVRLRERHEPEPSLILEVEDTGAGIDPAVREHLFEPFFTTKAATGGTGLGLSVVKSIVEEHRGTVEVIEAPGNGVTFRVSLPTGENSESLIQGNS